LIGNCVSDHNVERQLSHGDLDARNNVENIELVWLGALLSNWENLEPSEALNFVKNVSKVSPVYFR